MMAATHRLGGAAFGMIAAQIMLPETGELLALTALVGGAVLGSLIPDIDNSKSSISRKVPGISILVSLFQTVIRGISSILPKREEKHIRGVVGHRGITHSLTMLLLTLIFLLVVGKYNILQKIDEYFYFSSGIILGMASHIILDMFAGGVPLLCPLTNKRLTLAKVKTGGIVEWILRTVSIVIFAIAIGNRTHILSYIL